MVPVLLVGALLAFSSGAPDAGVDAGILAAAPDTTESAGRPVPPPAEEQSHPRLGTGPRKLFTPEFKIQIGPNLPSDGEDLARPGEYHHTERGGIGSISVMLPVNQFLACGLGVEFGVYDLHLGESYPLYEGPQGFTIGTWSWLLHAELRHPSLGWERMFSPYALFSVGLNINDTDTRVTFPAGSGPAGIPVSLQLDNSFALRAGVGLEHRFGTGIVVGVEGAWKRNVAGYDLVYSGEPDRTGTADLSWFEILGGIRLAF